MLDILKSLALPYPTASGNLTLWLLPFTSLRVNVTYEAFEAIVPKTIWGPMEYTFANAEAFLLDVQVSKGASPIERTFGLLWEHRNDDMTARWELFRQLYSEGYYKVFDDAYEATRDRTFDAPLTPIDKTDDSPEHSPALTLSAAS